jgi:hypothetical protein
MPVLRIINFSMRHEKIAEKTCKTRSTIRSYSVKQTFLTKVFVFVIVLWMGKQGIEKDWVGARMKDVGVG